MVRGDLLIYKDAIRMIAFRRLLTRLARILRLPQSTSAGKIRDTAVCWVAAPHQRLIGRAVFQIAEQLGVV
jgi:hypothetical protein